MVQQKTQALDFTQACLHHAAQAEERGLGSEYVAAARVDTHVDTHADTHVDTRVDTHVDTHADTRVDTHVQDTRAAEEEAQRVLLLETVSDMGGALSACEQANPQ